MKNPTITAPSVSLPKGGGAIKGIGETFQPDAFSGTGTLSFPFTVPTARGLAPEIVLNYSSGAGNGSFGSGFSLPLSTVSRKTDNGIPRYNDTDTFVLSNAADLVPALLHNAQGEWVLDVRVVTEGNTTWRVTVFRPRTEGDFNLIEQWEDTATGLSFWRVVTAENITHTYGTTENSRISNPGAPTQIFSWLIDYSVDAKGNSIEYRYKEENPDNVPPAIYEQHRSVRANRYIESIRYGNIPVDDGAGGTTEQYAFEVVFDYGGYDLANPDAAPGEWTVRTDPFSTYRAGFEIRTLRLCHNILLFQRFPSEFENQRFLVQAMCIEYDEQPTMSFVTGVRIVGYRKSSTDGVYEREEQPPLQFAYSTFTPYSGEFKPFVIDAGGALPGALETGRFLPVDLYGEGMPGFLLSTNATTLYWRPQGNGVYGYPEAPVHFPIERDVANGVYSLTDIDGNGRLELVVNTAQRSGYYGNDNNGTWQPYRDFVLQAAESTNPMTEMVDLTGDGRADVTLLMQRELRYYQSVGTDGFAPAVTVQEAVDVPQAGDAGSGQFLGFADVFGDGLSHRICIRNGSVECWPSLGYGRFAPVVLLGNAPQISGEFDSKRLFLVDADGSGTTDIAYAYDDRVEVFLNCSGNSFAAPISIPLPALLSNPSQITFADVTGSGASAMVFTTQAATQHVYYSFTEHGKPYLLTDINNNLGALTRIQYSSSMKFYFADKRAGTPWTTTLPFPVQVVECVENIDQISKSKTVQRFAYHDGYYDPVEREFRGFGFVETWDTQTFDDFSQEGLLKGVAFNAGREEQHVASVYTKQWYHTGAYQTSGVISRQYEREYWQGDPEACSVPDSSFGVAIVAGSGGQLRQAYAALAGQVLRREVYALDGMPVLSETPYTVSEMSFHVRLVQPTYGKQYAVFFVYERESVASEYDRIANDPRTSQSFALQVDEFGNVVQSCQVFYPRRVHPERHMYPEQQRIECVAEWNEVANVTEGYRQLGVPYQSRKFAVEDLALEGQLYFSFEQIEHQVQAALAPYRADGNTVEADVHSARLLLWEREYYWNEEQNTALPLGDITERVLLHHAEEAVFSAELLSTTFGDKLTEGMLTGDGGYIFADGYWWNRGLVQFYYTESEQYYQAWKTENIYAPETSSLRAKTTFSYDAYYLTPVEVTEHLSAIQQNTSRVWIDYYTLEPWQLMDNNGTITQVQFDPLGQVIVSTVYGWVDGVRMGNDDIADYVPRPDPTFLDVLTRPEYYVQGMSDFFYYDAFAWMREGQPVCAVNLLRQTYCSDVPPGGTSLFQEHVLFFDGFGREIEKKSLVESGEAFAHIANAGAPDTGGVQRAVHMVEERWVVSGRTVYNNKGEPVEQYAPYFSDTPFYEDQSSEQLLALIPPPTVTRYDPLLRIVRVDTPKGFFTYTVYTPWEQWHYDEDDTVKESRFYNEHMPSGTGISNAEKQALEQAATFYNTPAIDVLDTLGNAFLTVANNLGHVAQDAFTTIVAGTLVTSEELWYDLVAQGYLTESGWLTPKFWPYEPGFVLQLTPPFEQFAEPTLVLLKQNCLTTYHRIDIEGRETEVIDPRLYYSNVAQQTAYYTIRYVYDMQGTVLRTDSADAGMKWALNNIFANAIYAWDMRGFCAHTQYDRLQRPVSVFVQGSDAEGLQLDQVVQRTEYGESTTDPDRYNLRGNVYKNYDQAGVETYPVYNITDTPLVLQRQLRVDYKTEANWNDPAVVPLEPEVYTTEQQYNALGDIVRQCTPDDSVYRAQYGVSGRVQNIAVDFADGVSQVFIESMDYTASGERKTIQYGNGVRTENEFEFTTERLLHIGTTRPQAENSSISTVLQNIEYTYDPVGNITCVRDSSYETVFCNQQMVEPQSTYTYDALYQLIKATGRQHPGIQKDTYRTGFKQSLFMPLCPVHPNDMDKLQQYTDYYTYDDSGNLVQLQHTVPPSPLSTSWTRLMNVADNSNRLVGEQSGQYRYDANGNAIELDNLRGLQWSWNNVFVQADTIVRENGNNDSDYFVYDAAGNRVRKVAERYTNGESTVDIEEKIYLGALEIKRQRRVSAESSATLLERQSLHVMDGGTRIAITSYWPVDTLGREQSSEPRVFRFQLDNNLGSSCVEVTQNAQIISYEEYFPYGGTAVIAGNSEAEVQPKDYRYSGKECDDSTGMYYYGARYYAPWIGRWINPDPAGTDDGLNLYAFVRGNPITFIDANGEGRLQPSRRVKGKGVKRLADDYLKVGSQPKRKRNVSTGPSLGGLPKNSVIRAKILSGSRLMGKTAFTNARLTNKYLVGIYYSHFKKVFAEDLSGKITGRTDRKIVLRHFKSLYSDSLAIKAKNKTSGTEITGEYSTAKYMLSQQGYTLRLGYAKGTGVDQIWQKGNEYLVVEAKGEGASLSMSNHGMQMSTAWVEDRLIKLYNSSDPEKKALAKEMFKAADLAVDTTSRRLTPKGVKANPAAIRGLVVEANWTPTGQLSAKKQTVPNSGVYFN